LPLVSIARSDPCIEEGLIAALRLIGGLEAFVTPGDRVLIKPNLNAEEGFTHPGLTTVLVRLLREDGVRRVVIGESTFGTAAMTDRLFRDTGYAELARELNVELINLNRSEPVEVLVPDPLVIAKVRVARDILEADKLINLPTMKVHYATGITVAMKNLKGVLVGSEKRRFHEVGLERAIADLNRVIEPTLNVVDAISCMEGMGPREGDLVQMNLILAGADAAAVDWVAAQVMGYRPEEIKYLAHYIEKTSMDTEAIGVVGESIESVRYPFRRARVEEIIPARVTLHEAGACSACMNALLLSWRLLQDPPQREMEVYLGTKAVRSGTRQASCIAFGDCCPDGLQADVRVSGCPPYPFTLGECLKEAGWNA
jgi:uncharacterized protein (DUF362 family)